MIYVGLYDYPIISMFNYGNALFVIFYIHRTRDWWGNTPRTDGANGWKAISDYETSGFLFERVGKAAQLIIRTVST